MCIQDLTAEEIKQIVEIVNEKKHQEEMSKYITSVHMKLLRYNVYCVLLYVLLLHTQIILKKE